MTLNEPVLFIVDMHLLLYHVIMGMDEAQEKGYHEDIQ